MDIESADDYVEPKPEPPVSYVIDNRPVCDCKKCRKIKESKDNKKGFFGRFKKSKDKEEEGPQPGSEG